MKVMNIIHDSIVDGQGMRTAIFFSGCPHRCHLCQNPQSWNYNNGIDMSVEDILNNVLSNPMNNVTLSGGDPLVQNEQDLVELAKALKDKGKNIWCYTGYMFEEIQNRSIMKYIDVLVDGKFEAQSKDLSLMYKGSSNQRVIDVQESLLVNDVILWE